MVKIAILGDIHQYLTADDIDYFNASDYALVLIVGDLGHMNMHSTLPSAQLLAGLEKPALFIAGNHDSVTLPQLIAEAYSWKKLAYLTSFGQERRVARLQHALGKVTWTGYSNHAFNVDGFDFAVICGRPFSTGGEGISCRRFLQKTYGIGDSVASEQRLCQLVDTAVSPNLIFLAHNGPTGLGDKQASMWGRDFDPRAGDFGDADWRTAIDYAKDKGKNVIAVIGGHMHQRTKQGTQRPWQQHSDNTHYINAARVPRIYPDTAEKIHYHVKLEISAVEIDVKEMFIPESVLKSSQKNNVQ